MSLLCMRQRHLRQRFERMLLRSLDRDHHCQLTSYLAGSCRVTSFLTPASASGNIVKGLVINKAFTPFLVVALQIKRI